MLSTRYAACISLFVCFGVSLALAQEPTSTTSKPEDQITQLEHQWLAADAKGDATVLGQIIADRFMGSSFDGTLLSKHDLIPENTGPGGFAGATLGATNVRVFGDTGILMGIINTALAKPIHVTLVCQRTPQGWQIIAAQLTPMH